MKRQWNGFLKYLFMFILGGFAYGAIENLTRGYSHISMFIAGGLCFILIGLINEVLPWDIAITTQMLISTGIITTIELITGLIVNVWLGLNVWDYSQLPYNYRGQICLLFSVLWFILSFFAILCDDYIRYYFMGEKKPRYKFL